LSAPHWHGPHGHQVAHADGHGHGTASCWSQLTIFADAVPEELQEPPPVLQARLVDIRSTTNTSIASVTFTSARNAVASVELSRMR
jgi:hypothetical protein